MLTFATVIMILANSVTYRSEKGLSFNRVTLIILLYVLVLGVNNLNVTSLTTGIGVYGGLFQVTAITQSFVVFISILAILILFLTSFTPKRIREVSFKPETDLEMNLPKNLD